MHQFIVALGEEFFNGLKLLLVGQELLLTLEGYILIRDCQIINILVVVIHLLLAYLI